MLSLCLRFNESEPVYANKSYAYIKQYSSIFNIMTRIV